MFYKNLHENDIIYVCKYIKTHFGWSERLQSKLQNVSFSKGFGIGVNIMENLDFLFGSVCMF